MNSPTSNLLHSIQALKNKLRNDHHQLQDIRKDFALPVSIPEEKDQEFKSNRPCGKQCRRKLIDLRKKQQIEIQQILVAHDKQKSSLITTYEERLQELQKQFAQRILEQEQYINSLQSQIANSQTQRSIFSEYSEPKAVKQSSNDGEKYEHIVNSLLQENAILMQSVEKLKKENRNLVLSEESLKIDGDFETRKEVEREYFSGQMENQKTKHNPIFGNKNRLKFSKASEKSSNRESQIHRNDENSDLSNFVSSKPNNSFWDEDSIMSEDMKLKTIKHLMCNHELKAVHFR